MQGKMTAGPSQLYSQGHQKAFWKNWKRDQANLGDDCLFCKQNYLNTPNLT